MIIAAVGPAKPEAIMRGICGFVMDAVGECPRCKLMTEEVAAGLARRQAERELMQEIEEHLAGTDYDDA